MKKIRIHVSDAAKRGFLRTFSPCKRDYHVASDAESWRLNGEALKGDWEVVGHGIRTAAQQYQVAQ